MLWIGIGVTLVAVVVATGFIVARRPTADLGAVSDQWISQHRIDGP